MKKYFLSIVALAGMLFATSCQESLVEPQVDGTTTFTIEVPGQMGTKAGGETYDLYVEVYKHDQSGDPLHSLTKTMEVGTPTEVSLDLVATQEYDIIFWAQKGATHNVDDLRTIGVAYYHNSEAGEAFYAILNNYKPINGNDKEVVLTRPFAQLNIGTLDEVSYGNNGNKKMTITSAEVIVSQVASKFSRVDANGTKSVGVEGVVYDVTDNSPYADIITINQVNYKYVSMDYLAIVDNEALVTVTVKLDVNDPYGVSSHIERTITNVPLKLNYKTNIVGNLITSDSDFTVTIDESWLEPDNDRVENFIEVEVSTPVQLQEALQNPEVDAVVLTQDIDLSDGLVFGTPSKSNAELPGRDFVIDGNGKTLKYVSGKIGGRIIDFKAETNGANLTIKNLTIENCVSFTERAINYNTSGSLTLENVIIKSGKDCSLNYAINLHASSDKAKVDIKDCEIWAGAQALNLWGEYTVVNVTNSKLYVIDNSAAEGRSVVAINNDGTNIADYSVLNFYGGSIKVVYEGDGETKPSSAIRNNTAHSEINIYETEVVGGISNPVAIIYWEGLNQYYSSTDLNAALETAVPEYKATGVRMINDLTLPLAKKAIYGTPVAVQMKNSGVFDGCNNTLSVENPVYNAYVLETYGGTIKNLNITTPAGRGIMISSPKEDIFLDNVFVDGPGYALNTTEHNGKNLYVNNSTFKGWTSLAGLESVSFTSCTFGENTSAYWQNFGYGKDYDRLIRPYVQTVFESCIFEQYFCVELDQLGANAKVTLKSCKCGDVTITKENYANYITIGLPAGRTLDECVIFE